MLGVYMPEFQLNLNNLDEANDWLIKLLNDGPYWILEAKNPVIGKWSMAKLWRSWMDSTANFMADAGVFIDVKNKSGKVIFRRRFDKNDAHELFTTKHLSDENGKRLSWSKKGRDGMRAANRGERCFAMDQHQQWMIERGIKHLNPKDSEYMRAMQEQNK